MHMTERYKFIGKTSIEILWAIVMNSLTLQLLYHTMIMMTKRELCNKFQI